MRFVRSVVLLAVVAALVAGAYHMISRKPAVTESGPARQRPAPLVRTAVADPTHLVEQSVFPGEVRASAVADVTSRISGRLGAVLVREGSFVARGGLVARIDDPELVLAAKQAEAAVAVQRARLAQLQAAPRAPEIAQVEASIAQAETTLAQSERDLARSQQLFADGLVARATVDRSQTDVELARSRLRAAREQLALLKHGPRPEDIEAQASQVRQTEVAAAQARARLRELQITSPIAGVVTRVGVEAGTAVSPQTVIATVATIRPVEVHVMLPETDLPRLRRTSMARITVDALPDRLFEGRIARTAPALDAASRSARIVVVIPNADHALRPGMFARTAVVFDERQAIVVPSDSVIRRGEATVVFVLHEDETVEERPVRTGHVEGNRTEIVEGIAGGETFITTGQLGLRDGMKVRTSSGSPGSGGPAGGTSQPGPAQPTPGQQRP